MNENERVYYHQYLTAIFQIQLTDENDGDENKDNDQSDRQKKQSKLSTIDVEYNRNDLEISCLMVSVAENRHLYFDNFSHFVFETLMDLKMNSSPYYIDKRFFQDKNILFDHHFRVFDCYENRLAYLFDCYCRWKFIKDYANLVPEIERKKIHRYIIDQAALLLTMPYMNIRYEQQNSNITPINDLFAVLTKRTECLSDYIQCSKSFFLEIIDAIYEASVNSDHKTTSSQDNSTEFESTLADVSKEELKIEPIVGGIYRNFCKKFRKNHKLTGSFINDATTLSVLLASPIISEIFIDLNSPRELLEEANTELPSNTIPTPTLSLNDNNSQIRNILNLFNLDSSNSNASASNSNSNNQLAERFYHESLLGILLSNSPLPSIFTKQKDNLIMFFMSNNNYEYQFFNQPTTTNASDLQRTQSLIDSNLSRLRFNLTDLFFSLLRSSPKIRFKTLKWLECCLATFNNRSKLWSNEILSILIGNQAPVSDGFMLNLSAVLLNLSKPFFASEINNVMLPVYPNYSINSKMLKIDPNYLKYCKKGGSDSNQEYAPYLKIMKQETVLISDSDSSNQTENTAENANQPQFITRCFYMAHKAFHLGFRVVHERFTTVWQENNSLQQRLESLGLTNLRNVNRDTLTTEQRETLRKYEENLTIYLSMRSTLLETHYINHMMEFYIASAAWINNLAVQPSVEDAMAGFKQIISNYDKKSAANYFSTPPSKCLSLIPEFIIQNIIDFLIFLRYFEIKPLSLTIQTSFEPLFIMVLLFMGSPNRMRNPHLRAKMAEMLEALLPTVQKNIQP